MLATVTVPFQPNYKPKKHLNFTSLRETVSSYFHSVTDRRQASKVDYSLHDALMSGFACMYFQSPSILHFQRQLEEQHHTSNIHTLFGVDKIPQDTQLRDLVDDVDSENFRGIYNNIFSRVQRGKHLKNYEFIPGYQLCSLDATQYYHSKSIHCAQCLTKKHSNGSTSYSHNMLQAAIMHPEQRQVLPLMPEAIKNSDGSKKQDCERNAGKRLLEHIRHDHPQLGLIILGDGLYSNQPFIEALIEKRMHYMLTAKPDDHKYMMEWLDAYPALNRHEYVDEKGRRHIYQWMNDVPLNSRGNAINVNYFYYQLTVTDKNGIEKITYKSSWVTDLAVHQNNVAKLVQGARCRWKIENECFNTLKNQGYKIEHNYGHGKKNLSHNFYLLTLLAFTFHQIFELTDTLFQACRKKHGSKRALWEKIRVTIMYFIFKSWEELLDLVYSPNRYNTIAIPIPT